MSSSTEKNAQDLQKQWAGGRDIWRAVPMKDGTQRPVQTRVKDAEEVFDDNDTDGENSGWPDIVTSSILYGFGAYNPRGQTFPDAINKEQHKLLQTDIEEGLAAEFPLSSSPLPITIVSEPSASFGASWWEGASIWEDGSSERGFIIAFPKHGQQQFLPQKDRDKQLDFVDRLAKKYNQGAIYKFEYETSATATASSNLDEKGGKKGRLMRDTIAILDADTDARVEVIRDSNVDLSPFLV